MKKIFYFLIISILSGCLNNNTNPVLHFDGNQNQENIFPVDIIFAEEQYYLFYSYKEPNNKTSSLDIATSQNLYQWNAFSPSLPFSLQTNAITFFSSGDFSSNPQNEIIAAVINKNNPSSIKFYKHNSQKWELNSAVNGLNNFPEKIKDIKIFQHHETGWHLLVSAGDEIRFYQTASFKQFSHSGTLDKKALGVGSDFSSIDIFSQTLENEPLEKWVLLLTSPTGSPNYSAGTKYIVGDFAAGMFFPSCNNSGWIDYGSDQTHTVTATQITIGENTTLSLGALSKDGINAMGITLPRKLTLYEEYNRIFLRAQRWNKSYLKSINLNNYPAKKYSGVERLSRQATLPAKINIRFDMNNRKYLDFGSEFGISFNSGSNTYRAGYQNNKRYYFISRGKTDKNGAFQDDRACFAPVIFTGKEMEMQVLIDKKGIELFALDGKVSLAFADTISSQLSNISIFTEQGGVEIKKIELNQVKKIQHETAGQNH
ncbi:MAG: GH32 C-terminal domain-containing protein [Bacteroidota bacterium]